MSLAIEPAVIYLNEPEPDTGIKGYEAVAPVKARVSSTVLNAILTVMILRTTQPVDKVPPDP